MIGDYELQTQVEQIIKYSQAYPFDLNCKNLIRAWRKAKKKFIDKMGGKTYTLLYPEKISIVLSEDSKRTEFVKFLNEIDEQTGIENGFRDFVVDNETGFFANRVVAPSTEHNIPKDSKLLKSFNKFMDRDKARQMQDTASRHIQKGKIEGYLYMSVDPRDFLSLSDNVAEWSSCHSLDGDYRGGNLNYMVDDTTVIFYLSNGQDRQLKCFPKGLLWNSKNWRTLIHYNENGNTIYYERHYPYTEEYLETKAMFAFMDLMGLDEKDFYPPIEIGFNEVNGNLLTTNQMLIDDMAFDSREFVDATDYVGFCDIIESAFFKPKVQYKKEVTLEKKKKMERIRDISRLKKNFHNILDIKIGEPAPCPCCGVYPIAQSNSFICDMCIADYDADEDFYTACRSCGHRIYDEDEIFVDGDDVLCKHCYNVIKHFKERFGVV